MTTKLRFQLVEVPGYTAIHDEYTNETILSIHTQKDAINSRDKTYLTPEEMNKRKQFILAALNAYTQGT